MWCGSVINTQPVSAMRAIEVCYITLLPLLSSAVHRHIQRLIIIILLSSNTFLMMRLLYWPRHAIRLLYNLFSSTYYHSYHSLSKIVCNTYSAVAVSVGCRRSGFHTVTIQHRRHDTPRCTRRRGNWENFSLWLSPEHCRSWKMGGACAGGIKACGKSEIRHYTNIRSTWNLVSQRAYNYYRQVFVLWKDYYSKTHNKLTLRKRKTRRRLIELKTPCCFGVLSSWLQLVRSGVKFSIQPSSASTNRKQNHIDFEDK